MAANGEFSFRSSGVKGRNNLPKIHTDKKASDESDICHDDSATPVKAQTLDELHSLQKKKSAPTTPIQAALGEFAEEDRHKQQMQSISASLASLTRETGPKVVKGDPARAAETPRVAPASHHHFEPTLDISDSGLKFTHILYNLSPAELYEQAIKYEKGSFITASGALATMSGAKTGRSPRDKRVVKDETTDDLWWGKGSPNIEMDEHTFLVNRERAVDYLCSLEKVYVNDQFLNWDPEHRIKVRIVSARAYHSLFMHNMCIRPTPEELESFGTPDFTIYNAGQFPCNRYTHYMTSSTSIDVNLARKEMVILGTQYAGEMKKGLFSLMHYLMPKRGVLSLHSGCNMGKDGDVALFFGLSGTGKTTLSTDHNRYLIGDDEHCWSDNGVSNIEGGCYAKCIDLSREKEPDIWNAIKFGAVLENVVFDEHTREVDYSDKSVTVFMLNKAIRKSSELVEPEREKATSSAPDAEKNPKRQKTSSGPKKPESTSASKKGRTQKPPRAPEKDVVLAPPSEHICEPFLWPTDFAERNDMLSKLVAVELSKASNDYAEMQRKLAAACHRAEQAEANFEKARAARISAQDEAQFAKNQLVIQREQTKRRDAAAVVAQGEGLRAYTERLFLSSQFSAFVGSLVRLIADKGEQGPDVVLPLYSREIAARLQNLPLLEELASSSVLLSADRVRSCRADRDENLEAIFASVGPVSPASTYNGEGEAEPLEREAEVDQAGHPEKEADQEAEARPAGGEAEAEVAQEKEAVPDRGAGDEAGGV